MLTTLLLATSVFITPTPDYTKSVYEFGTKFLSTVSKDQNANAIVSPLSAHMCLSMLANGVKGKTGKQLQALLGSPIEDLNTQSLAYLEAVKKNDVLTIANGCWSVNNTQLAPTYTEKVRNTFFAELAQVSSSNGADIINKWVYDKTRERIDNILQPLDPLTRLVLVNALAFDGTWIVPFKPENTQLADFHTPTTTVKVPMMHMKHDFLCGTFENRKFVRLPYKKDYEMIAMLPGPNETPLHALTSINSKTWQNLNAILSENKVTLAFPKFKSQTKMDLKKPLSDMGAPDLFIFSHDFDSLVTKKERLAVSEAIQKVMIEVDETGTKAAAATVIGIRALGIRETQPFEFIADRPFAFVLLDSKTRVPIIMGVINDPTK